MSTIIFIEDSSKSLFGGGQKISSIALDEFKRVGKQVIYVDFVENPKLKVHLDLRKSRALKLYHNSFNGPFGLFLQLAVLIPNYLILMVTILRVKDPVIYTTTKRALIYGGMLGMLFRVPYIYHAHMVPQGRVYDRVILFIIRKALRCICVSEYVLHEFQKKGLKNGIVLENPVESLLVKNSKSINLEVFRVVFIGSVIEIKGLSYLLDIFNDGTYNMIEVHVFGDGKLLNSYREKYGKNQQIFFHGFVSDINHYLNEMADVLVLPSIIPEAAPTSIQQAMQHGIPIITTNIGGQNSFVENSKTGVLVRPRNTNDILNAILKMKDDIEFYEFLSMNCKEKAKEFKSIEEFGHKLVSIINQSTIS